MIQIENQGGSGSIFAPPSPRLEAYLKSGEILAIQSQVHSEYEGEVINVKNLFCVLRRVFELLDEKAPHLSDIARTSSALDIISNIIEESEDANKFTIRALKLLAEYSVETIANESKPRAFGKEDSQALEEDHEPVSLSTQLEQNDKLHRSRFDDVFAACEESLLDSLEEEFFFDHDLEAIEIPSKKTSKELSQAVAANPEEIDKQAEEAKQYIRKTSLEIDEKVADIQQKLRENIEKALLCVDEVRKTVKEALEDAHDFSDEIKDEVAKLVNQFAEKMIDAIQTPTEAPVQIDFVDAVLEAVDELDEKVEELEKRENLPSLQEPLVKIPACEILASD